MESKGKYYIISEIQLQKLKKEAALASAHTYAAYGSFFGQRIEDAKNYAAQSKAAFKDLDIAIANIEEGPDVVSRLALLREQYLKDFNEAGPTDEKVLKPIFQNMKIIYEMITKYFVEYISHKF